MVTGGVSGTAGEYAGAVTRDGNSLFRSLSLLLEDEGKKQYSMCAVTGNGSAHLFHLMRTIQEMVTKCIWARMEFSLPRFKTLL
jgi:hypothetical protein